MLVINKWIVISIVILFFSCRTSNVIPEKDMISILVNIYLTDATITSPQLRPIYFGKDTIDYYAKTLSKVGYTSAQFDSSLNYYAKNPKQLDAIYDKVIIELSKKQTELVQASKADSVVIDTLKNLWTLKANYKLKLDSLGDFIIFEIPVVGLGTYTFNYNLLIFPDDESLNPQSKIYFYYDNKSENGNISNYTVTPYTKDGKKREIKTVMNLKNSLVTHLKGVLLDYNNTNKNFKSHANVTNIRVTYKPNPTKTKKSLKKGKQAEPID
jgi:hypothetical protein